MDPCITPFALIGFGCSEVYQIPTGRVFVPEDRFAGKTLKLKLGLIRELHTRNIGYEYEIVHHKVHFTAKNDLNSGRFLPCDPNQDPERLERTTPPRDGNEYSPASAGALFRILLNTFAFCWHDAPNKPICEVCCKAVPSCSHFNLYYIKLYKLMKLIYNK